MNDNDQVVMLPLNRENAPPKRIWADDDATAVEDMPADFNAGLTSLGFIRSALRRTRWVWATMAVAGLLIGSIVYMARPASYQATTTLLLTVGPESVPGSAIANEVPTVESHSVAGLVVRKLGLPGGVNGFVGSYTATPLTDRVLLITVNAPSGSEAVTRARTLAAEFLQYRAQQLEIQQRLLFNGLDQQLSQAKLSTESRSSGALAVLQTSINNTKAAAQEQTASEVKNSQVLDTAALVPAHGRLKHLALFAAIGLIAGLALSIGIIVIRALISDRLRRRDDVARALGAPVRLSVGSVRLSRWLPGRHGLAAAKDSNVRRIVTHLDRAVPTRSRGAATLAIVPVDDLHVAALSLVSLAMSRAQRGHQVVLADLASGAPAAGLLGVKEPGVHTVRGDDAPLIVAVPERDDMPAVGPCASAWATGQRSRFTESVRAACGSADALFTLAPLDPSLGGEHLPTWAADAVVTVTAGRSSWTKIHSAGEMIRLAGTRLLSAVLIGADLTDDSLGVTLAQGPGREREPVQPARQREPAQQARQRGPAQPARQREPSQQARRREPAQPARQREPGQQARQREPGQQGPHPVEEDRFADAERGRGRHVPRDRS